MKSQEERILAYLLKPHRKLTPLTALTAFSCFRLSARVHSLREYGVPIQTTRVRTRDGKFVAQYHIAESDK